MRTHTAKAAFDLAFDNDDSDLTSFISRPDIRVPRFNVTHFHPTKVVPGFWFVAPYAYIQQERQAKRYYQPCQTGPSIYDYTGVGAFLSIQHTCIGRLTNIQDLVWTGACSFRNQNAVDFRSWKSNGSDFLSMILFIWEDAKDRKGHAVVLNQSYSLVLEVHVPKTMHQINMHEFNVIEDGRKTLYIVCRTIMAELPTNPQLVDSGLITDLGFYERDLGTGEVLFQWWASDHISLNESSRAVTDIFGPYPNGWNWIHLNSVDKNTHGDYLVSARYTNAIYKISGQDGSILWTLGGNDTNMTVSSFHLEQGFNFSRQHDARFLSQTDSTEVIMFLDNGGDEFVTTSNFSAALVVSLDKTAMKANVIKRWMRPGDRRSKLRGNTQLLPNGNVFTGWSDNCHISEHSWDGELLMEASFRSDRFVTYRAWKYNFTGHPTEPPDLKTFAFGTRPASSTTVYYVSWNGATDVSYWDFYRVTDTGESIIGRKARTGFETMYQSDGYERMVFAEAIAADGSKLGRSVTQLTTSPSEWHVELSERVWPSTDALEQTCIGELEDKDHFVLVGKVEALQELITAAEGIGVSGGTPGAMNYVKTEL